MITKALAIQDMKERLIAIRSDVDLKFCFKNGCLGWKGSTLNMTANEHSRLGEIGYIILF